MTSIRDPYAPPSAPSHSAEQSDIDLPPVWYSPVETMLVLVLFQAWFDVLLCSFHNCPTRSLQDTLELIFFAFGLQIALLLVSEGVRFAFFRGQFFTRSAKYWMRTVHVTIGCLFALLFDLALHA